MLRLFLTFLSFLGLIWPFLGFTKIELLEFEDNVWENASPNLSIPNFGFFGFFRAAIEKELLEFYETEDGIEDNL